MQKILLFIISLGIILLLPWGIISITTGNSLYRDIETIPNRTVGVLLGTSPGIDGRNLYFTTRIQATKKLYERGKIKKVLVSGDNATASYNEPLYMKNALIQAGIPEKDITLDYAGFRTLDSVVRAKEVFSLTWGFTIISQPFHVERALYLARAKGIDAIGFGAANVSLEYGLMPYVREIGARWLALYDAWFDTNATVLGEKVEIITN